MSGRDRLELFREARVKLPNKIPVNVIMFPMEGDPFALIEAMTIAAYAVGATHGYIYVRAEYPLARARLAWRYVWLHRVLGDRELALQAELIALQAIEDDPERLDAVRSRRQLLLELGQRQLAVGQGDLDLTPMEEPA